MYLTKALITVVCAFSFVKSTPFNQRIINGTIVKETIPWVARIATQYKQTAAGLSLVTDCGGSLIAAQWVLTAKHCLLNATAQEESDTYHVLLDSNYWPSGKPFLVTNHFFYSSDTQLKNDLALLKLEKAPAIDPIPIQLTNDLDYAGKTVRLYGWGVTDPHNENSDYPQLRQTDVILDGKDTAAPDDQLRFDPRRTQTNSCMGDSGGPMTILVKGIETLIGASHVSEYGSDGKTPCVGTFSEYTKTFYPDYATWITDTMANN